MNNNSFNKDICIIVQGPIDYIDNIIETYNNFKTNVIISTTEKSQEKLKPLYENGFNIITNDLAKIPGLYNFNNQVKTTFNGIKKAKELNFKYILKIRSDIFIEDVAKFLNLINYKYIYFSAYHNHIGGYLCEHMLFGEIDLMLNLWNIPESNLNIAPEIQLTSKFDEINKINNYKVKFLFPILFDQDIKAFWPKYNKLLNDYKDYAGFTYSYDK